MELCIVVRGDDLVDLVASSNCKILLMFLRGLQTPKLSGREYSERNDNNRGIRVAVTENFDREHANTQSR